MKRGYGGCDQKYYELVLGKNSLTMLKNYLTMMNHQIVFSFESVFNYFLKVFFNYVSEQMS